MPPIPDDQEQFEDITVSISNESDDKSIHTNTGTSTPQQQYDLRPQDSSAGYSIESSSDNASVQMAQYLDDVESAGGNNDTCSFQDVNLNESSPAIFPQEEEVRRARKRYYLLPMLIRYSLPIGGCLLAFAVVLVTIGVTASVVRANDEKRMGQGQSEMNLPEIQGEGFDSVGGWDDMFHGDEGVEEVGDFGVDLYDDEPIYDDAPVSLDDYVNEEEAKSSSFESILDDFVEEQTFDDAPTSVDDYPYITVGSDEGDEEVSGPIEFESTTDDQSQGFIDGDGDEEVGTPIEFTSSTDDGAQVDRTDTLDGETVSHTSSNSGGHPKWYSTSHPSYVSLLEFHSSTTTHVSPHHTAALFCNDLGGQLCSYSSYCPSGKNGEPYNGGPDGLFDMAREEWDQWAPVNTHGQGVEWVQVGKIVDADGSFDGRCRRYDEWSGGESVDATVAPEHRRYILCCDSQNM